MGINGEALLMVRNGANNTLTALKDGSHMTEVTCIIIQLCKQGQAVGLRKKPSYALPQWLSVGWPLPVFLSPFHWPPY